MNNKIAVATLLCVITLLMLASCERNGGVHENELSVLGTFAQISIVGLTPEAATEAAHAAKQDLLALDYISDAYGAEGELQRLNEAIGLGRSMEISDTLLELITTSRKLSIASNKMFNPALGELTSIWGFLCEKVECTESPYPDDVKQLIKQRVDKILSRQTSMTDLNIKGNSVSSRNPQVKLEFADLIRGLALDNAIEHLIRLGVSNAMINIGGNIRTTGTRGDHHWWIGIPDATGKHLIGSIENVDNKTVVTLRAYDSSIAKDGLFYRHVIDPLSGIPVQDIQSVTVVHESAMIASAAATTLLVAGIKDWKIITDAMDVHQILLITKQGTIYTSPAMEHIIHWKQGIHPQYLVPN